jgi:AcrR family transcriptional regulator
VTVTAATAPPRAMAPAKARILETAMRRFYDDGIKQVGVDLLIAESQVTKATFYKHFGSKDRLVHDYIASRRDAALESLGTLVRAHENPCVGMRLVAESVVAQVTAPGYRGCPFQKAAAEFADPAHPVRTVVTEFHESLRAIFTATLTRMGHPLPGAGADELVLAYDGTVAWSHVGDVIAASSALRRVFARVASEADC